MLAMSAARVRLHLGVNGLTVVVGVVALAIGISGVAGVETSVWPLVPVVIGATFIFGALYGVQLSAHRTSTGRGV
jgi:hypothetical protein